MVSRIIDKSKSYNLSPTLPQTKKITYVISINKKIAYFRAMDAMNIVMVSVA